MPKEDEKKDTTGLTVKKDEDMSEWYSQIVTKSQLADYSPVSGCIVFRPLSYELWENVQAQFNKQIKESGHKNCYFPLLIPESLLTKEKEHVEGFNPEVAWVEKAGDSKLSERLAIRPTSETIMYESYKDWIRSWRDLPLLLNQWNSVLRWEFKHAKPFLRTREFLWQEGHTAHATEDDASKEVMQQLFEYVTLVQDHMAVAVLPGKKSEKEKFAGANYTTTIEALMPDGKALQMATSHLLGQSFAKAFGITFVDKDEKEKHVWQTSWGLSTRTLGAIIMVHGDDKGLVLPPRLSPTQAVIVPIIFKQGKEEVLKKCEQAKQALFGFRVHADLREEYSSGWKFNHYELQGVPIRIEIGPKDVEKDQAVIVKRNTGEKRFIAFKDLHEEAGKALAEVQTEMFEKSKEFLFSNIVDAADMDAMKKAIGDKKLARAQFCGKPDCEDKIKDATGALSRCFPFEDQKKTEGTCVNCDNDSVGVAVFGKSY